MRRWGLVIALLLSLGVNLGVLGTLAVHRLNPRERAEERGRERRWERGERERDGDGVPQQRLERLADRMELQGAARERFLVQQRQFFAATRRDRLGLRRVRADLRRQLIADQPDRARIAALAAEASRIYLSLEKAMAENVLATRELLGPEQEAAFLDFVARVGPGRLDSRSEPGERPFRRRRHRF